jgi:hypothetical protein
VLLLLFGNFGWFLGWSWGFWCVRWGQRGG